MLKNIRSIDYHCKTFNHTALGFMTHQNSEIEWSVTAVVDHTKMFTETDDGHHFRNIEGYTLNVTTET